MMIRNDLQSEMKQTRPRSEPLKSIASSSVPRLGRLHDSKQGAPGGLMLSPNCNFLL